MNNSSITTITTRTTTITSVFMPHTLALTLSLALSLSPSKATTLLALRNVDGVGGNRLSTKEVAKEAAAKDKLHYTIVRSTGRIRVQGVFGEGIMGESCREFESKLKSSDFTFCCCCFLDCFYVNYYNVFLFTFLCFPLFICFLFVFVFLFMFLFLFFCSSSSSASSAAYFVTILVFFKFFFNLLRVFSPFTFTAVCLEKEPTKKFN